MCFVSQVNLLYQPFTEFHHISCLEFLKWHNFCSPKEIKPTLVCPFLGKFFFFFWGGGGGGGGGEGSFITDLVFIFFVSVCCYHLL